MKSEHCHVEKDNRGALGLPVEPDVRWVLDHALNRPDALRVVRIRQPGRSVRRGYHCHSAWEILCPVSGALRFECQGEGMHTYPDGTVLLIPPDCPHMAAHKVEQSRDFRLLVLTLPGEEYPHGGFVGVDSRSRQRVPLTAEQYERWASMIGSPPAEFLHRAARAVGGADAWGRERAVAMVRLLFIACMQAAGDMSRDVRGPAEQRLDDVLSLLRTEYFNVNLTASEIAASVGLSASHVRRLLKAATGKTLHQTLLGIRLRRAAELLVDARRPVKEVAFLTGWKNPLYFSAAFRKHYGVPPSAVRGGVNPPDTGPPEARATEPAEGSLPPQCAS